MAAKSSLENINKVSAESIELHPLMDEKNDNLTQISNCPCIECRDPHGELVRTDSAVINRKDRIQHRLKLELPDLSNEKIIDLSMHLAEREMKLLKNYQKKNKSLTSMERESLYAFPVYTAEQIANRVKLHRYYDGDDDDGGDEVSVCECVKKKKKKEKKEKHTLLQSTASLMTPHHLTEEQEKGDVEIGYAGDDVCGTGRARSSFSSKAIANSWRLCTLKYGLKCISFLALVCILVYTLASTIIEKHEFWRWAEKLNEGRITQKVECNSTPRWVKEALMKHIQATNGIHLENDIVTSTNEQGENGSVTNMTFATATFQPETFDATDINQQHDPALFSPEYDTIDNYNVNNV